MYRILFIVAALLAAVAGLLVGTLNSEPVTLDLLWVQLRWPLGLVALLALSLGLVLGLAGSWLFQVLPLRVQLSRARRNTAAAGPAGSELVKAPADDTND
jgi:uncharacterized integral membrane protein